LPNADTRERITGMTTPRNHRIHNYQNRHEGYQGIARWTLEGRAVSPLSINRDLATRRDWEKLGGRKKGERTQRIKKVVSH